MSSEPASDFSWTPKSDRAEPTAERTHELSEQRKIRTSEHDVMENDGGRARYSRRDVPAAY